MLIDPDEVPRIVEEATGERQTMAHVRPGGTDRVVQLVTTGSGMKVVVRMGIGEGVSPEQEAWYLDRVRRAGVPVPDVLWVGSADTAEGEVPAMVESHVAGRPLTEVLGSLDASGRARALATMGETLGRLHSIGLPGYYRRRAEGVHGRWTFLDLAAFRTCAAADRRRDLVGLVAAGLDRHAAARADALIDDSLAVSGDGPAVLCHGDFGPDHVYVDESLAVTGVIDFSDGYGGRPFDDLVVLGHHWPELGWADVAAGYGAAPWWDDVDELVRLGRIAVLVQEAASRLRTGRRREGMEDIARLHDAVATR